MEVPLEPYVYTAWFEDTSAPRWDAAPPIVACVKIEAPTPEGALAWGDHLAQVHERCAPAERFLRSQVRRIDELDPWERRVTESVTLLRSGLDSFAYSALFEDVGLPPDDPDREWVGALVILAPTLERAQAWGDHLARSQATRGGPQSVLRSEAKPFDEFGACAADRGAPRVLEGEDFRF